MAWLRKEITMNPYFEHWWKETGSFLEGIANHDTATREKLFKPVLERCYNDLVEEHEKDMEKKQDEIYQLNGEVDAAREQRDESVLELDKLKAKIGKPV